MYVCESVYLYAKYLKCLRNNSSIQVHTYINVFEHTTSTLIEYNTLRYNKTFATLSINRNNICKNV